MTLDHLTPDISGIFKYMERVIASGHDTEQRFFVMYLSRAFICNGEGRSMKMLYTQKNFVFLQKWTAR